MHAGLLLDDVTPKLAQIVLNRLLSNRAAEIGDVLPATGKPATHADDRGGWWADPTFGSRLWLLTRAKLTGEALARAVTYADEALQPLVDSGILGTVAASADYAREPNGRAVGIDLLIEVTQPDGSKGSIRYDGLWKALGNTP